MGFPSTITTRLAAAISLLGLIAITASDFFLAVVNEFVAARSRRKWEQIADYGLVELGSSSRHVWITLAQEIGLGSREEMTKEELRTLITDHERLSSRVSAAVVDPASRHALYEVVAALVASSRATLINWAPFLVETPHAGELSRFIPEPDEERGEDGLAGALPGHPAIISPTATPPARRPRGLRATRGTPGAA